MSHPHGHPFEFTCTQLYHIHVNLCCQSCHVARAVLVCIEDSMVSCLPMQVDCNFADGSTRTVVILSIGLPTSDSAEMWLEDPVYPLACKCFTVPINALRPIGCSVDPEYEALVASKLIESNRDRCVEAASGQCDWRLLTVRQAVPISQLTPNTFGLFASWLLPQLKISWRF